jgi:hypothetical protein
MGTKKTFSDSFRTFTCCVGSGMENHAKYQEGIYYEGSDGSLYVNLFIPSQLDWRSKKILVRQQTVYPDNGQAEFTVAAARPAKFKLRIRKPGWAKNGYTIRVNSTEQKANEEDGFIVIDRTWKNNDKLVIELPMSLYTESMPDNKNRVAFLYGPLVLAGVLGNDRPDPVYGVPVLLTDNKNITDWLKPAGGPSGFTMQNVGKPFDVKLVPFYKVYKEYYSVYWDFFSNEQWVARQAEYEAEKKKQKEIEDKTIDHFRIGEMQPERDHNLVAGERSYVSDALGVNGREARKGSFFSFEMTIDSLSSTGNSLLLTYIGDDKDRKFDISVNGQKIATEEWKGGTTGKFYTNSYALPPALVKQSGKIIVRIDAAYEKTAGRIFGARTVRN